MRAEPSRLAAAFRSEERTFGHRRLLISCATKHDGAILDADSVNRVRGGSMQVARVARRVGLAVGLLLVCTAEMCPDPETCDTLFKNLTTFCEKTHQCIADWQCVHTEKGKGCLTATESLSGGTGGSSPGASPAPGPTGSGSSTQHAHIALESGLAVNFHTRPCDPHPSAAPTTAAVNLTNPKVLSVAMEHLSPAAVATVHAQANGADVSFSRDSKAEALLAREQGGSWFVFTLANPSAVFSRAAGGDLSFDYKLVDRVDFPADGVPPPVASPGRLAVSTIPGSWSIGKDRATMSYDHVVVSFTAPEDASRSAERPPAPGSFPTVITGHPVLISKINFKSTVATPLPSVPVRAVLIRDDKEAASVVAGKLSFRKYGVVSLTNIKIPTTGLAPGLYVLHVTAGPTAAPLGDKLVQVNLSPGG